MSTGGRGGGSLPETLVALLLGFLLLDLALTATARVRAAQAELTERTEALLSFRVVGGLLRAELRAGRAGRDWALHGDTLGLRAFRGRGLVCPEAFAPDAVLVSYSGYRSPDASKDSLLVVGADGAEHVLALRSVSAAAGATCAGLAVDRALVLHMDSLPPAPAFVRVFERGTYSVSGAALRYQRGSAGRQPLTPEAWSTGSRLTRNGSWTAAELTDLQGRAWDLFLAGGQHP